ncbi:MAG: hypothetical protein E5X45_29165 [Mesorhizobium sp.]|nr:MAG: hypothetical protein EOR40_30200 [Mesorhizobium sp.]TIP15278.1 MAG: hypothetical protein E5X66_30670 [Mesorhizobium sp.]TJV76932.1 MAG: hypothetical protein E5X45_29165 [Mesorhizobium sp.]
MTRSSMLIILLVTAIFVSILTSAWLLEPPAWGGF